MSLFILFATIDCNPSLINVDYLLQLWLGTIPKYTSQFLLLALITALINVI